jgi:GntR family transcriptional regulator
MLFLHIDPHSGVPVYRQIMDQIKHHLASGSLREGDLLPSIRELAKSLSVNPTTVVKAYGELAHEGVIENRHGKGAFISTRTTTMNKNELETALRKLVRRIAVEVIQLGATPSLAARLLHEEINKIQKGGP